MKRLHYEFTVLGTTKAAKHYLQAFGGELNYRAKFLRRKSALAFARKIATFAQDDMTTYNSMLHGQNSFVIIIRSNNKIVKNLLFEGTKANA